MTPTSTMPAEEALQAMPAHLAPMKKASKLRLHPLQKPGRGLILIPGLGPIPLIRRAARGKDQSVESQEQRTAQPVSLVWLKTATL